MNPRVIAGTAGPNLGGASAAGFPPVNMSVKSSCNRMYVVLGAESQTTSEGVYFNTDLDGDGIPEVFESVADLLCKSCDGIAGPLSNGSKANVGFALWNEFVDLDVSAVPLDGFNNPDGRQFKYQLAVPYSSACLTYLGMLLLPDGHGYCGAWAQFYTACMMLGGVGYGQGPFEVHQIRIDAPSAGQWAAADGLVARWMAFQDNPPSAGSSPLGSPFDWNTSYVLQYPGVAGQGNADPVSTFQNHAAARLSIGGGQYVLADPSYGNFPEIVNQTSAFGAALSAIFDPSPYILGGYIFGDAVTVQLVHSGMCFAGFGAETDSVAGLDWFAPKPITEVVVSYSSIP